MATTKEQLLLEPEALPQVNHGHHIVQLTIDGDSLGTGFPLVDTETGQRFILGRQKE